MLPTPAIDGASPVIAIVELKHFRINGCILCWLPANSKEKVLSLSVHRLYRLISALEMCRFSGPVKLPPPEWIQLLYACGLNPKTHTKLT
jgi:hypothetical protein